MVPLISMNINTFNSKGIAELFLIFKNDFLDSQPLLQLDGRTYIIMVDKRNTCSCPFTGSNKCERFWHIVTTSRNSNKKNRCNPCPDKYEKRRKYDSARAKRIHWIKPIIEECESNINIKHFFQKRGNKTSLVLWHTVSNFVVIIRKIGKVDTKFLVTSYLIYQNQVHKYKKQLKEYEEDGRS